MALRTFLLIFLVSVSIQAAEIEKISKHKNKILISPAPGESFRVGDRICVKVREGKKPCGKIIESKDNEVIAQMDELVDGLKPGDLVQPAKISSSRTNLDDSEWEGNNGNMYFRVKGGASFYSNMNPITSAVGLGFDFGFKSNSGFGISAMGILNLKETGQVSILQNTVTSESSTLFLGLQPTFSITRKVVYLSFGLGLGVLNISQDVTVPGSGVSTNTNSSISKFALAPNIQLDFPLGSNFFVNAGFQYVLSFGEAPKPGFLSPMGGFSYSF
jgi:hypothetical protein